MHIAYIVAPGKGDTDLLMQRLAEALQADGFRVCGTIQINTKNADDQRCDMDIQVLPKGPTLRISQSLGAGSNGCRLNPEMLEHAVTLVEAELGTNQDLLIINKFGKHEADGRGFRQVIAQAVSQEIPVIVGVNKLNQCALDAFVDRCAISLPPTIPSIMQWVRGVWRDRNQYGRRTSA